jgi:hypothetical protein
MHNLKYYLHSTTNFCIEFVYSVPQGYPIFIVENGNWQGEKNYTFVCNMYLLKNMFE